jgi:hypothetical protein
MKTSYLILLTVLFLVACKKEVTVVPKVTSVAPVSTPATTTSTATSVTTTATDTMPNKAGFKLKLSKDSVNYDEAMFLFKSAAKTSFDPMEDGQYFAGFGQVSLASISSDDIDLAINALPYKPGMVIGLDVNARSDGAYSFSISYQNKIPPGLHIWLKDAYRKDSVDVRTKKYTFNVIKADTTTYGDKRFRLVIRK